MFQGVSGPETNFYIHVLKQSCYISSFFTYICKDSPFRLVCLVESCVFYVSSFPKNIPLIIITL
jgi:hypothetical protein